MKYYLVKWPNKTFSIVGAKTAFELLDTLDELGDPTDDDVLIAKLPSTNFGIDLEGEECFCDNGDLWLHRPEKSVKWVSVRVLTQSIENRPAL